LLIIGTTGGATGGTAGGTIGGIAGGTTSGIIGGIAGGIVGAIEGMAGATEGVVILLFTTGVTTVGFGFAKGLTGGAFMVLEVVSFN